MGNAMLAWKLWIECFFTLWKEAAYFLKDGSARDFFYLAKKAAYFLKGVGDSKKLNDLLHVSCFKEVNQWLEK